MFLGEKQVDKAKESGKWLPHSQLRLRQKAGILLGSKFTLSTLHTSVLKTAKTSEVNWQQRPWLLFPVCLCVGRPCVGALPPASPSGQHPTRGPQGARPAILTPPHSTRTDWILRAYGVPFRLKCQ